MLGLLPTPTCLCVLEIVAWSLCLLIFPLVQLVGPKELAFSGIVWAWGVFVSQELSRYA